MNFVKLLRTPILWNTYEWLPLIKFLTLKAPTIVLKNFARLRGKHYEFCKNFQDRHFINLMRRATSVRWKLLVSQGCKSTQVRKEELERSHPFPPQIRKFKKILKRSVINAFLCVVLFTLNLVLRHLRVLNFLFSSEGHYFQISWIHFFICGALRDLILFVQFKKREKHPWRSVNFRKVAGWTQMVPNRVTHHI